VSALLLLIDANAVSAAHGLSVFEAKGAADGNVFLSSSTE
jgi:hypothetical protein